MKRWINILGFTGLMMLRHWRSTLSLILVYAFIVFAFASVLLFVQSLSYESGIVLNSAPELIVQRIIGGRLVPMENSVIQEIAKIRGVSRVNQRNWGYYFDAATGAVFTIIGSDSLPKGTNLILGEKLFSSDTGFVAVCGTGFLELRNAEVGSHIVLPDPEQNLHTFRIVGAFTSASDLLSRDLIVLPNNKARQLLGINKQHTTDLSVEVANPDEVETIAKKIGRRLKSVRVVTRSQLKATYVSLFSYRGSLFQFGFAMSMLAFIILAWQKAGGLSPDERREIGIQKAVGWSISDIIAQKLCEGLIISLNATLLGLISAAIHVFQFDAPLLRPFLVGWSVLYPEFHLIPHVEISSLLLVIFFSVIPYLAATIIPSWRIAISDPDEVMHAA